MRHVYTLALVAAVLAGALFGSAGSASARPHHGHASVARATHNALTHVGARYVYGGTGGGGYDCSGLVQSSFRAAGFRHMPRTSRAQAGFVRRIPLSSARRGDLFFYHSGGRVFHVAIYLGHGRVVEAAGRSTGVRVGRTWGAPHFAGTMRGR